MACVNPNTEEFKEILKTQPNPLLAEIQYELKAVNILSSTKGDRIFDKAIQNKWELSKTLSELQIPKDQQELIFNEFGREAKIIPDLKDRIITSLLANNSYTIEINTAKTVGINYSDPENYDEIYGTDPNELIELNNSHSGKPTQHYSDLTVPGGTNYIENEIATPAITPSIKGHAQFATDKGIGWFRSDDKDIGGEEYKRSYWDSEKNEEVFINDFDNTGIQATKTRRILEVQSEIFQKGRDIKNPNDIIKDLEKQGKLKIVCD